MNEPGESVEARILSAALRHLRRDGLKRLTVVRIAEDAGMTHANIYRYFRSKSDLAERILIDWLRGVEQRLADISQAPDPADDKLERFLTHLSRSYIEKAQTDPKVFALLPEAMIADREVSRRHRLRVRALMAVIVEEGLATRLFAGGDVRRIEQLIVDVMARFIEPLSIQRMEGHDLQHSDSRRDRVIRLLIRGLAAGRLS